MAEVVVFEGNIELKKELLDETPIRLDSIEGWDELDDQKKLWLSIYFDTYPNESQASLQTGFGLRKLTAWKKEPAFKDVMEFIEQIHKDTLAKKHFDEAYTDPKIRFQVLKSLKAKGYEPDQKTTNNNTLNIKTAVSMEELGRLLNEKS